jgi:hypothetical protein
LVLWFWDLGVGFLALGLGSWVLGDAMPNPKPLTNVELIAKSAVAEQMTNDE